MKEDKCESGGCCKGPKLLLVLIAILLAGVLVAVAFNAGASMNPANITVRSADNLSDTKLLSVSGNVSKMVSPNKVDITLSVETVDKLAQKSQSDNALIANTVRAALAKAGVADSAVKTVSYSVNEEFQWNDFTKKSESVGYRTVNSIQVTLYDTNSAGKIVDVAVGAGANNVSSIVFGLTKEKELDTKKAVLTEASQTAKAKADAIAKGVGIVVGKVHSVSES